MALDFNRMLMQLSPVQPVDFGSGQKSYAREQLELARQQFEETKRQHQQQLEQERIQENGRNARAEMDRQEALRKEAEQRQATLLAQQQGALQKFGEVAGTGKVQQAQAMVPYLDQLGYDVNTLGNVGGLPVFQMQNRAQEAQRADQEWQTAPRPIDQYDGGEGATQSLARMDAEGLGYPTNERGVLDDPSAIRGPSDASGETSFEPGEGSLDDATTDALDPGDADTATAAEYGGDVADVSVGRGMMPASLSQGDAYAQALAASQSAKETGRPVRGPDEEDFQGAVPRNVIDLPAMNAETNARLSPMLKSITGSLPAELQPGAEAAAQGAAGLGLEATDALGEYGKAIAPAIDIYKGKQNIEAQKEKNSQLSRMDRSQLQARGATKVEDLYKERGIDKSLNSINKAAEVDRVLDNDTREDDGMVANAVMEAQNLKGAPSNTDLEYAFGIKTGSLLTKGLAVIQEAVAGGMSDAQKAAVKSYMKAVRETQQRNLTQYLDNGFDTIDNDPSLDPEERAGFKSRLERSVPSSVYNTYWDEREKREKESGARRGSGGRGASIAPAGAAGEELQRQAEAAGLNGQVLGKLMGGESGGDTNAASDKSSAKGVFQLIDETAKAIGYKDAADYAAQPLEKQIEGGLQLFKNKGITADSAPEDYALVLAAPSLVGKWKSRDDVVYKKDSDEWKANAPWRPTGGGDITVGSIADYYMGKGGKTAEAAPGKLGPYDTALSPAEEREYQTWKQKYAPKDSGDDYDLRGAFKAGVKPSPENGHWPDTFKKPNHPTFSVESKYASAAPDKAGHWDGDTYVPARAKSATGLPEPKTAAERRIVELLKKRGG